ncbi:MAG: two-component system, OmpR family, phosphate regulon response regulator PhoB [Actinomycetota bacterium]|nr:two-component system, OmpR family, phosphate regulon response regulator PhoB [Actinomycetota bacterium]
MELSTISRTSIAEGRSFSGKSHVQKATLRDVEDPLVLIAEDDPSVRMTIEMVLEGEGFRTMVASDGEEALRLATSELPDMILLDQGMPKVGGKEVVASLRRQELTREIPVLVLSGRSWGTANEWPGAEFLGKPFSPDELLARIRDTLKSRR